ncbi:MAG: dephospho-CoA kinase [Acidimicrobiia bacterium]|nr:dephospho-CoA kinase [Acidimicrobiia bacterium]
MAPEVPSDGATDADRAPIRILLGGGIGAGKTAVGEALSDRGFSVVDADRIGHDVLENDADVIAAVAERWPAVMVDGAVDRPRLAAIVFAEPAELEALERIVHPRILSEVARRLTTSTFPVVVEIPLLPLAQRAGDLVEGRLLRVAIVADADTRLARAVARGGDPDDVIERMAAQATDREWASWADVIIDNGGPWAVTEASVDAIVEDVRTHG